MLSLIMNSGIIVVMHEVLISSDVRINLVDLWRTELLKWLHTEISLNMAEKS